MENSRQNAYGKCLLEDAKPSGSCVYLTHVLPMCWQFNTHNLVVVLTFSSLKFIEIKCNKNRMGVLHNACLIYKVPFGALYTLSSTLAVDVSICNHNSCFSTLVGEAILRGSRNNFMDLFMANPHYLFMISVLQAMGRDSSVGIATRYAGRSGDRIPVGARFSAPVQTGPGASPASYTMGTGSLSRG